MAGCVCVCVCGAVSVFACVVACLCVCVFVSLYEVVWKPKGGASMCECVVWRCVSLCLYQSMCEHRRRASAVPKAPAESQSQLRTLKNQPRNHRPLTGGVAGHPALYASCR